jgi:WhiB family transcriptional regulator, redox-sensing transcriptional regulator
MARQPDDEKRTKHLPNVSPLRSYLDRGGMARLIAPDWRLVAACRSTDPDLFFPVSSTGKSAEDVAAAKAVCSHCLVQRECLAFALRTRQAHGIWGGQTEEERQRKAAVREDDRTALDPPAIA